MRRPAGLAAVAVALTAAGSAPAAPGPGEPGQITGVRRGAAAVTLTGPHWTELLTRLADEAYARTQGAVGIGEDPDPEVGAAYWALVDAISIKLGGPRHPKLHHR